MTKLEKLLSRRSKLNYLKSILFPTKKASEEYFAIHKEKYEELHKVERRIREIKWNSKSIDQRKSERLALLKLAEKFDEKKDLILFRRKYLDSIDLLYQILKERNLVENNSIYTIVKLLYLMESKDYKRMNYTKFIDEELTPELKSIHLGLREDLKLLDSLKKNVGMHYFASEQ